MSIRCLAEWLAMSMSINEKCLFLVLSIIRYYMVTVKRDRMKELKRGRCLWVHLLSHTTFFLLNLLLAHIKMMTYLTSATFVFLPFLFSFFLISPLPSLQSFFFPPSSLFFFLPMYYFKNEFILSLAILGRLTELFCVEVFLPKPY